MTINKAGSIFLNVYATTIDTLGQHHVATVKDPKRQLFLQADKDVPYGVVVDIMGRIKAAGIEQMGIVAEKIDDLPTVNSVPAAGGNQVRRP